MKSTAVDELAERRAPKLRESTEVDESRKAGRVNGGRLARRTAGGEAARVSTYIEQTATRGGGSLRGCEMYSRAVTRSQNTRPSTSREPRPYSDSVRSPGIVFFPFLIGLSLHLTACDFLGFGKSDTSKERRIERRSQSEEQSELSYVGREACGSCHEEVVQSYTGSAHDRATEVAKGEAVEAPFWGEKLLGKNLQATFTRENGAPLISSGKNYPVKWTIGASPLQQYLVEGDGGRFQAFSGAFDTRNKGDGGQVWYFLDDGDAPEGSPRNFGGKAFVWNSQCARCHSTAAEKNYDLEKDTYDTKFRELDVSCEACHGPASRHVALAEQNKKSEKWPPHIENAGFDRALAAYTLRRWVRGPDEEVAKLSGDGEAPPETTEELQSCAPCHSTSTDLGPDASTQAPMTFSDRFALQLMDEKHFFPDGQAKANVYSYNSFVQTKKQHAGVICSDCHDPHAGTLRSPPSDLCVSCHAPELYRTKSHTLHEEQQEVTCVDCHLPEKEFLGLDKRRDHSFPTPRPFLTLSMGLPNACGTCHSHRPKWTAAIVEEKLAEDTSPIVIAAFHAAEKGLEDAPRRLEEVLRNQGSPEIVRASALKRWAELGRSTPELTQAILSATKDESVLVRRVAAEVVPTLPEESRIAALSPLWEDKVRSVRIAAAVASLEISAPEKASAALTGALLEAKTSHSFRSDEPEGLIGLAATYGRLGNAESMSRLYELAIKRHPESPETFSSWARELTRGGKIDKAQEVVVQGLALHPKDSTLLFARGRHLVRLEKAREALPYLHDAFENAPRSLRREAGYVLAVTTYQLGDWAEALAILRLIKREYPEAREIEEALKIYEQKRSLK